MKVTMLLCDAAQTVGGKLYILGGGWNQARVVKPLTMALAVLVEVPWDQSNRELSLHAELHTDDGQKVSVGNVPIESRGSLEVGRPPGMKPGSDLSAALTMQFEGIPLEPGSYVWVFTIDGTEMARSSFSVLAA